MFTRTRNTARPSSRTAMLVALATLGSAALTTTLTRAEEWKWSVTPYAWATDVGVDVSIDDQQVIDETIPVNDLLEELDATAQMHVEGQRGEHGVLFDLFYVHLSDNGDIVGLPGGMGQEAVLDSKMGLSIFEVAAIYDPRGDEQGFGLIYGARIFDQQAQIDASFQIQPDQTLDRSYDASSTLADAMVGVRFLHRFSKRFSTETRVDVSAGGTDLTWSAGSTLQYALGTHGRYTLEGGYRRMVVQFAEDDLIDPEMTLSGPFLGLKVSF